MVIRVGSDVVFDSWEDFANNVSSYAGVEKAIADAVGPIDYSSDTMWLIICASMVFFMQCGFTLLEVGSVSIKNTKNILIKNVLDACFGCVAFYLVGYAFALGDGNGFIGTTGFVLKKGFHEKTVVGGNVYGFSNAYSMFFFQWAFAATAATIVSGAVAERCKVTAYFAYSIALTSFVYPVVVHWGWSSSGWASAFMDTEGGTKKKLLDVGVIDFAGSTVVHTVGGVVAVVGAAFLGPRRGRFNDKGTKLKQQNATFQTIGALILWFGWYGFNCGSTLGVSNNLSIVAGKTAATTTISAATGGVTAILLGFITTKGTLDIGHANNGILAGLVSITANCSVVEPEFAFLIGIIGGFIYFGSAKLLELIGIDDVVNASPVHLFCGIWGTVAAGLFAHPDNVREAYGEVAPGKTSCGLFYKCDGYGSKQFFANLIFIIAVLAWTTFWAIVIFGLLRLFGSLRVTEQHEIKGADMVKHGGEAYENPLRRLSQWSSGARGNKERPVIVKNSANDIPEAESVAETESAA